jgi:HEAT repeat protein
MGALANVKKSTQYLVLGTFLVLSIAIPARGADPTAAFLGRTSGEWLARLESDQPAARAEAAWATAQLIERNPTFLSQPDMQSALIAMISKEDAAIRFWGIHGLNHAAKAGPSEAIRQSARDNLRRALVDKSPAPRIAAAEGLALLGDADAAIPVLIEAMVHPQDAVRIQAVAAFEKLGEAARPVEKTLRAATGDSSEYVKRIATRALQKLDAARK